MEHRSPSRRGIRATQPHYLDQLHREEDVLKEAQKRVCKGDPLPKDMYNTVMKWSSMSPKAEDVSRGRGQRREKKQSTSHSGHKKEASEQDLKKEEEELRQELKNMRELTQSNIYLLEENKRLMRKVQQLRQRAKRQEEVGRGSRESVEAPREDEVILALKKKYEDLLQYVLKVEAENQKMNSLIGASGERRSSLNDTDPEASRQTIKDLQKEIQTLRGQLMEKDDSLRQYEQHLRTLKDNNLTLQESRKRQGTGEGRRPETTVQEEEWMKRFTETREMYEEAIQGYKDQLEQTQRKLVEEEQEHARQVEELKQQLGKIQDEVSAKEKSEREERHKRVMEETQDHARQMGGDKEELEGHYHEVSPKESPRHQKTELSVNGSPKNMNGSGGKASQRGPRVDVGGDTCPQATATIGHSRDGEGEAELAPPTRTEKMYGEALELIVRRLENLQVGGEEVESMVEVIRGTISTCLQEWRDNFHQPRAQDEEKKQLQGENEELQKKLKGKNKKIETLQRQNQDLQRQNDQLLHQHSVLESRMASSQTTEQLGILSGLPQKVQEVEQQLSDTKELLYKAQAENQELQGQVKHLEEKLGKKESKLRAERELSISREREVAGAHESASSLQHQLEEVTREMSQLREQLSTKDAILEHTSAQLEERIRECASLFALTERYKLQQNQDTDRIQTQMSERETASHKQFLEAQAQASRYQAQMSALRTEKEHNEKSLRSTIKKLEEQVDQIQLRNSTLQRQLTTFTSTYHTLFSGVDLQPVTTTAINLSGFKGV